MDYNQRQSIKFFLIKYFWGRLLFEIYKKYYFFYQKKILLNFLRKFLAKNEAIKILKKLKKNNYKKIILIYDCKVSASTIGDFFSVLMLGKYFASLGYFIHFYIIDGEYRTGWRRYRNNKETREHLINLTKMTKGVLEKNFICSVISYQNFMKQNLFDNKNIYMIYKDRVKKRIAYYQDTFILLNFLMSMSNRHIINKTLLNKNDFRNEIDKKIKLPKKFIAIHCRYATKRVGVGRNANINDFIKTIKLAETIFPKRKIIIVSDKRGCNFFKKIAKKKRLDCLFSKKFSKTFLGDSHIILNSEYFLQLFGGGTCVIPWFSNTPCIVTHHHMHNEIFWNNKKLCFWHNTNQLFNISKKNFIFYNRLSSLKKS